MEHERWCSSQNLQRHGAVGAHSAQRTINILDKNDNDNNNESLPNDL
jgi:hypothetical protein